ncbi:MAG: PilZ domain-containing protein [Novosphingobium sp.]
MAALWAEISEPDEAPDRRGSARRTLRLVARAAHARTTNEVLILDLSTTGLMLETATQLRIGDRIEVELPNAEPVTARVIWQRNTYFGCEFLARVPVAAISAALLRAAPRMRGSPGATAASNLQTGYWDVLPTKQEPARQSLTLFLLILLLVAAITFTIALLTLSSSAG